LTGWTPYGFYLGHLEVKSTLLTGKAMGKPWLTMMFDGATRMVLAHYLSYQAPSYASVYAVMRIYMRRHR